MIHPHVFGRTAATGLTGRKGKGLIMRFGFGILILILILAGTPSLGANNPYGVHLLPGSPSGSMDWAKSLVGDGGYVKQLFYGITNSTTGPNSGWVDFVNQCYARNLIPVCRLGTQYNGSYWTKPVADSPGNYTSFANAVKRVVQGLPRNDNYPLYIELLNEVNSTIEWSLEPNPTEYAQCLVYVANAIRSIGDPRIKIMNAGMAGGASFADQMFANVPESLWAWDVWSTHCYSLNRPPELNKHNGHHVGITIDMYLDETQVIANHGRTGVQVMITETGYQLGDHTWSDYPVIDEANRADYIMRAFRDYWSKWPEVLAVTPFQFCDPGWRLFDWVYPDSGTGTLNRPTKAHQQYYDVWNLAKPNMIRGSISGRVIESSHNTKLAGATVVLNPGGHTTTTDANGNYFFPNSDSLTLVSPGSNYSITASMPGFTPQTVSEVSVTAGENTVRNFSLTPSEMGSISGIILDSFTEAPISGVTITLSPGGRTATTNSSGEYLIADLSPATYDVNGAKLGYYSSLHPSVIVSPGQTSNATFYLGPGYKLPGNMISNTDMELGEGLAGVAVGWETPDAKSNPAYSLDPNVRFTGRYSQKITANGTGFYWLTQWTGYSTIHSGQRYRIECWVKTSGISGANSEARIQGIFHCNDSSYAGVIVGYPKLTTTNGWTLLVGYGTAPSFCGGDRGRLRLEISAPSASGSAWFDQAYVGLDGQTDSPVCVPLNFTSTRSGNQATLTWKNPPSDPYSTFTGTTVVYRTDRYPTGPTDGTLAGEVAGTPGGTSSLVHNLNWGFRYYYGAFAHTSGNKNYSKGSYASVEMIDSTPPTTPVVIDEGKYTRSTDTLSASWSANDPESGVTTYAYCIGTTPGGTDVAGWAGAGSATSVTRTNLSLSNGETYYISIRARNGANQWSDIGSSDGIRVAASADTITQAKRLPDGQFVWLQNKLVSAVNVPTPGYIYIQEENRNGGIRVESSGGVVEGNLIEVAGIISGGGLERIILSEPPTPGGTTQLARPLATPLSALGGSDFHYNSTPPASGQRGVPTSIGPNNVGLLVTAWGRITAAGESYFYIDDGSGILDGTKTGSTDNKGVRVQWNPTGYAPGDYMRITGISSIFESGPADVGRLLIPRKASDVQKVSGP